MSLQSRLSMENIEEVKSAAPVGNEPVEELVALGSQEVIEESTEDESDQPDYRKLYEETEDRLKKAEFALYRKNKAAKQERSVTSNSPGIDPEEINAIVDTRAIEILEAQRKKDSEDLLEEELMRASGNPDERDLIKLIYDNGIVKTGYSRMSIRNDLDNAKALANKDRHQKEKKELANALNAKRATTSTGVGSNQARSLGPKEDLSKHFTASDWHFIQQRKWTDDMIRKAVAEKRATK